MSNGIKAIIDLWRKRRSAKDVLKYDQSMLGEFEDILKEIELMDAEERKALMKDMRGMMRAIQTRLALLQNRRKKMEEQMKLSRKSKNACIAYHNQGRLGGHNKKKTS